MGAEIIWFWCLREGILSWRRHYTEALKLMVNNNVLHVYRISCDPRYLLHLSLSKLALKKNIIWPCKRVLYYRKVNISEFTVSLNYLITMKTLLVRSSPFQANNHKQNITKQNIWEISKKNYSSWFLVKKAADLILEWQIWLTIVPF